MRPKECFNLAAPQGWLLEKVMAHIHMDYILPVHLYDWGEMRRIGRLRNPPAKIPCQSTLKMIRT